ncbi:MAG: hypothetical protein ACI4LA_01900 [Emergencia sp.]
MTWGAFYMYYQCPQCGRKFRYALDLLNEMGDQFGRCPDCGAEGTFIKEGPVSRDSMDYVEVE